MIPHDILTQIFDHAPDESDITWNSDVIRVQSCQFHGHFYSRVDINLSQGVVYFFKSSVIVKKMALEIKLQPLVTKPEYQEEPETQTETFDGE